MKGNIGLWADWQRWALLGALSLLLVLATAFVNRDVYSKSEVDKRVEGVEIKHEKDMQNISETVDRIDGRVEAIYMHLIKDKAGRDE